MEYSKLNFSKRKKDIHFKDVLDKTFSEMVDLDDEIIDKLKNLLTINFLKIKKKEENENIYDKVSRPYENNYLFGWTKKNKQKFFKTLEEAINACEEDNEAGGIVGNSRWYTIRKGTKLYNKNTLETSWLLLDNFREKCKVNKENNIKKDEIDEGNMSNEDDIDGYIEIIRLNGKMYIFNTINKTILDRQGNIIGLLKNGKLYNYCH